MYVVRLIVATRSSGPPASGKIIKEMPGSVASGTPYIRNCENKACLYFMLLRECSFVLLPGTERLKVGQTSFPRD